MNTWEQVWEATQTAGAGAYRTAWDSPSHELHDFWVATYAGGPGLLYLIYKGKDVEIFEPTEEDRAATDWLIIGEDADDDG